MKKIAVIGSINMDMTVRADRIPGKGETVSGRNLCYNPGGKGANQAVAAARLGGYVSMFGCVGEDSFGESLIRNLEEQGVRTEHIRKIAGVSSGVAMITVAEGDNVIVVVPGANDFVKPEYLGAVKEEILRHDIILLQNEIPDETVRYAIELCHKAGKTILYNPAPARRLETDLVEKISYLTPNEHEIRIVLSEDYQEYSRMAQDGWLDRMLLCYPEKLIVTLGSQGVKAAEKESVFSIPSRKAKVVDTTGAGDTFNGAFALALAEGRSFAEALRLANAAAGLSVEKEGAQAGMPDMRSVERCLCEPW